MSAKEQGQAIDKAFDVSFFKYPNGELYKRLFRTEVEIDEVQGDATSCPTGTGVAIDLEFIKQQSGATE
jgi:hypothetical protein